MTNVLKCTVLSGNRLQAECDSVDNFKRRFYVREITDYLISPNDRMGLLLFGNRRVGKSVSLFHAIKDSNINLDEVMYLECNSTIETFDIINFFEPLYEEGLIKYLFIDEASLISDIIEYSNYLVDRFNRIKVVLSGSSSFVFFLGKTKLLGRCHKLYPTYISYKEWNHLGMGDIWSYIKGGGILLKDCDKVEYLNDFVNNNVKYSLNKYINCSYVDIDFYDRLETLIELYPRFVIKCTELLTNEFSLDKLKSRYKSRISSDRELNKYLIDKLNMDYKTDSITSQDIEFLADLLVEGDFFIRTVLIEVKNGKEFKKEKYYQVQPCLRLEQFRQSVDLIKDLFPNVHIKEVRETLEGFVIEDTVRLNIYKYLNPKRYNIYELRIDNNKEVDIVVESDVNVYLIEVKRSDTYDSKYCKHLVDDEMEERFKGKLINRLVIYGGETQTRMARNRKVVYVNIEEFLKNLPRYLKPPIMHSSLF